MNKQSVIVIRRTYNDSEYPNSGIIGVIKTALDYVSIQSLWNVWRKEVPEADADSQFVDWLIEKKYGVKDVSFEVADV